MAIFVDKGHSQGPQTRGCVYQAGAFITQNTVTLALGITLAENGGINRILVLMVLPYKIAIYYVKGQWTYGPMQYISIDTEYAHEVYLMDTFNIV